MTLNEPDRQVEIANDLHEQARALAHSTREIPRPGDTYALLGSLGSTVSSLRQVCAQLATFHARAVDGRHYAGEDGNGNGDSATLAAESLARASEVLSAAEAALGVAHSANGTIRWID